MSDYQVKHDANKEIIVQRKYLTAFQRKILQKNLQDDLSESYRQRIEIMLLADEGKSQSEICQIVGCCPATARHWMHIARSGMAHQWQDCPLGRPKAVNEEYLERLQELVNNSPRDYGYSFRRWTVNWLNKQLAKELGIEVSDRHLKRLLKQMGLSTKPKPQNAPENKSEKANTSKISISDLKSEKTPENSGFLSINLAKLGSDIYGGTSARTVNFFAAAKQVFGIFSWGK